MNKKKINPLVLSFSWTISMLLAAFTVIALSEVFAVCTKVPFFVMILSIIVLSSFMFYPIVRIIEALPKTPETKSGDNEPEE